MLTDSQLRERLDREKKAIQEAGPSLQADLSVISDEISNRRPARNDTGFHSKDLDVKLKTLESKYGTMLNDIGKKNATIQADLESSLIVSEKKAKSLDELYREANAENELLYERFNTELGRVLKSVKEGDGLVEMRTKLKEAQDEAARLRKENQRLKRENLGLRSQLKGV